MTSRPTKKAGTLPLRKPPHLLLAVSLCLPLCAFCALVMHNFLDADWDAWNRKMRRVLIESQEREGCASGSWDPDRPTVDAWGGQGGRLMMTSFNTLTLEVYYRYLPLFQTEMLGLGRGADMGFVKPAEKPAEVPAEPKGTE